ncbi:MAG: radical SAM protein [Dehalococcoidales bacterium]|nr:radical SAM protein [Dehalococcoidales bacterium]
MKIYLLNPPYLPRFTRDMRWQDTGRGGTLYYPIWLAYATGVLEQAGFETRLVDTPAMEWGMPEVIADMKKYQPDFVVVDTSFPSLNNDLSVSEVIKETFPDVKTAMVGAPASQFAEKMLSGKGIDFVARWEFDFVLRDLMIALNAGNKVSGVKGISYKNGSIIHNPDRELSTSEELDTIPFVSQVYKKHLDIKNYMLTYSYSMHPEVQIFTGRGCPFQCTFCSWPQTLMGRKHRVRSIDNVLDEMEWVEKRFPEVKQVFIEDDTFPIDSNRVLEFCRKYEERGLTIPWGGQARVGLEYETMKAMKSANCMMVDVGYESGNDSILKNVKKGITVEKIKAFPEEAKKAGLSIHGNWIIGLPGETKETIANTVKLIKETKADAITVAVVTPFPGTEMYDWAKKNDYLVTEDPNEYLDERGHQKSIISYPELSSGEIRKAVDGILKNYYLSFSYVPIACRRVFSKHGWNELKVLWRSAIAFLKYLTGK